MYYTISFYRREQNIGHQTSDFMEILRCMNVKTQSLQIFYIYVFITYSAANTGDLNTGDLTPTFHNSGHFGDPHNLSHSGHSCLPFIPVIWSFWLSGYLSFPVIPLITVIPVIRSFQSFPSYRSFRSFRSFQSLQSFQVLQNVTICINLEKIFLEINGIIGIIYVYVVRTADKSPLSKIQAKFLRSSSFVNLHNRTSPSELFRPTLCQATAS